MYVPSLTTLNEFIINDIRHYPSASGKLGSLLRDLAFAAKRIHVQVNKAGLADTLRGSAGYTNTQGEEVQKLDYFANKLMIQVLQDNANCAAVSSEEEPEIVVFDNPYNWNGKYIVHFDPIDGSGNIDIAGALGTTFCIYQRLSALGGPANLTDFLQMGNKIIAAGYILYGSSTILVYANDREVNGFTLDTSIGEFCLSHPQLKMSDKQKIISINTANYQKFSPKIQQYLWDIYTNNCEGYSSRYIGAMVADIHRTLLQGGIFLYPATQNKPNGKLRLAYECNPMAYIIKQAGGDAFNEAGTSILDLELSSIHQRSTLFIGAISQLEQLKKYLC